MRNNTNYMEIGRAGGARTHCEIPPDHSGEFLSEEPHSIQSGKTDAPYGYVFPANQPDMTRVAFIVNILRMQGIEVGKATGEVKLNEGTFPAGSLIIKRDQPYGRLAKILLEKQNYPDPNLTTYDDTGWTMGLMSHAQVKEIAEKRVLDIPVKAVDTLVINGEVKGGGPVTAVLHNGSNSLITLRYRLKDLKFEATEQASKSGETSFRRVPWLCRPAPA